MLFTPVLAGAATIKGLGSASVTYTGVTATLTPISGKLTDNAEYQKLKDGNGNTRTLGASDPNEEFQLELFVTGADVATAKTLVKPTPLQVVTLASLPYTEANGTYNYMGGWDVAMGEGFAKISLKLARFNGAALAVI